MSNIIEAELAPFKDKLNTVVCEIKTASNPYDQMGRYVKKGLGISVYLEIENTVGKEGLEHSCKYHVAFVTEQGVPEKYGTKRSDIEIHAVEAMRKYLGNSIPMYADFKGTFIPVYEKKYDKTIYCQIKYSVKFPQCF